MRGISRLISSCRAASSSANKSLSRLGCLASGLALSFMLLLVRNGQLAGGDKWQNHPHLGALFWPAAGRFNRSAVFRDDSESNGEAQAGPSAVTPTGKEWLEEVLQDFGGHAAA